MFSIKNENRNIKLLLFISLAFFITVSIINCVVNGESLLLGSMEKMDNDDVKYLRSAWTLLETGKFTYNYPDRDTVFIMPGITLVLSLFVKIFGKYPILQFQIAQSVFMAFGIFVVFLICRKIFDSKIGIITAMIMSVYVPCYFAASLMLTETIFSVLFFLLFLVSIYAIEEKKMRYYIIGGILLGFMVLFRPAILPYPVVIFCIWLIKKYNFKEMVKFALPVILIVVAMLTPWWIRNAIIFDRFIPLTLASGNPMIQGTYINYDSTNDNMDYYSLMQEYNPDLDLEQYGKDEIINDEVERTKSYVRFKEVMTKEPLKYIQWYTIGKTIKNFEYPFMWKELFGVPMAKCFQAHTVMLYIGLLGFVLYLILNFKKAKPYFWMMLITVAFINALHLPFYCFPRYVFPIMNFFLLTNGYVICLLFETLKSLGKKLYVKYKKNK